MRTRIEPPPSGLHRLRLGAAARELWGARDLLTFLTIRNVRVQYAQALIGIGWVLLQPILTLLTFTLFFGILIGVGSDDIPYPIFAYAAILPWSLCASTVTKGTTSLVESAATITKVYYPRLLVPVSALLARLVDFAVGLVLLVTLFAIYGRFPEPRWLWCLPLTAIAAATALSAALWLGSLNVRYRDVQAALPFLLQLWFFATPVVYPSSVVPDAWRSVYAINPMTSVVDGFRWALLDAALPPGHAVVISSVVIGLSLSSAIVFFRASEPTFADRI